MYEYTVRICAKSEDVLDNAIARGDYTIIDAYEIYAPQNGDVVEMSATNLPMYRIGGKWYNESYECGHSDESIADLVNRGKAKVVYSSGSSVFKNLEDSA